MPSRLDPVALSPVCPPLWHGSRGTVREAALDQSRALMVRPRSARAASLAIFRPWLKPSLAQSRPSSVRANIFKTMSRSFSSGSANRRSSTSVRAVRYAASGRVRLRPFGLWRNSGARSANRPRSGTAGRPCPIIPRLAAGTGPTASGLSDVRQAARFCWRNSQGKGGSLAAQVRKAPPRRPCPQPASNAAFPPAAVVSTQRWRSWATCARSGNPVTSCTISPSRAARAWA